jgi:acetoin utilization protein AcuB
LETQDCKIAMKKSAEEILKNIKELPVDEYSTPISITGELNESARDLIIKMDDGGVRHVPIFKEGTLIGMVSDRDVRNLANEEVTAEILMSKDVYEVASGTLLREVVFEMSSKKIGSVIIKDSQNDEYSIFTSVDALNALNEILQ